MYRMGALVYLIANFFTPATSGNYNWALYLPIPRDRAP
ncbi:hypothetical protein PDE_05345 [Penicillium oxalicum 114-2]|uniref:Uncharacterized protein n=1 Tax=Penicillium oxalicum (strain 114-2 / CGMCC 5302) TaxID=933388 RepID=S7ZJD6_PENO1|nr:hypothetical protein PDE_05345 [Penicillium oxalicum 114-2]